MDTIRCSPISTGRARCSITAAERESNGAKFELLWPLLDIATTLDSKLIVAYRFGAIFLSEPAPTGAGRPDLAIELVKRGIAENPDNYFLSGDLGFLYYWRMKDYPKSAASISRGQQDSERALVAEDDGRARSGKGRIARNVAHDLVGSLRNPRRTRQSATGRWKCCAGSALGRTKQQLDELAQEYKSRFGHFPASSSDLLDAGLLRGDPVDPAGYPYVFGPDGKSSLDPQSPVVIPPGLQPPREESK